MYANPTQWRSVEGGAWLERQWRVVVVGGALLKGLLMVQLQQLRLALAQNKPLGHTELYCPNNVASVTP